MRVIEIKDARKTFTIKLQDIRATWEAGVRAGKDSELWVYFNDGEYVLKAVIEKLRPTTHTEGEA